MDNRKEGRSVFTGPEVFWTGALSIPAVFFVHSLAGRIYLWLLFLVLVYLQGKTIRFGITCIVMGGIVLANLFPPLGKILWQVGPFPLTDGALIRGLERALTLETLVFLSKASIQRDLTFPGNIGALIAYSLYYFEQMLNIEMKLSWKEPLKSAQENLDTLLLSLSMDNKKNLEVPAHQGPFVVPSSSEDPAVPSCSKRIGSAGTHDSRGVSRPWGRFLLPGTTLILVYTPLLVDLFLFK